MSLFAAAWMGFCAGILFTFVFIMVVTKVKTDDLEPRYDHFPSKQPPK